MGRANFLTNSKSDCENNKRSVKVGCDADFIMLEPDTLQLVSTWVAGVKVFPQF